MKSIGILAFIALTLFFGFQECQADEIDALILGKSWHFDGERKDYSPNQWNYGGGLEYRAGPWIIGGMTYRDSFRQQAYALYGGYQYTVPIGPVNVFAAVRAGYLNGSGWHGPGVLPSVGLGYGRFSLEATFIPKARKGWNCVAVFARVRVLEW